MTDEHSADSPEFFAVDQVADDTWRSRTVDPAVAACTAARSPPSCWPRPLATTTPAPAADHAWHRHPLPAARRRRPAADYRGTGQRRLAGRRLPRLVTVTQEDRRVAIAVGFHTPRGAGLRRGPGRDPDPDDALPRTGTPHKARAVTEQDYDITTATKNRTASWCAGCGSARSGLCRRPPSARVRRPLVLRRHLLFRAHLPAAARHQGNDQASSTQHHPAHGLVSPHASGR